MTRDRADSKPDGLLEALRAGFLLTRAIDPRPESRSQIARAATEGAAVLEDLRYFWNPAVTTGALRALGRPGGDVLQLYTRSFSKLAALATLLAEESTEVQLDLPPGPESRSWRRTQARWADFWLAVHAWAARHPPDCEPTPADEHVRDAFMRALAALKDLSPALLLEPEYWPHYMRTVSPEASEGLSTLLLDAFTRWWRPYHGDARQALRDFGPHGERREDSWTDTGAWTESKRHELWLTMCDGPDRDEAISAILESLADDERRIRESAGRPSAAPRPVSREERLKGYAQGVIRSVENRLRRQLRARRKGEAREADARGEMQAELRQLHLEAGQAILVGEIEDGGLESLDLGDVTGLGPLEVQKWRSVLELAEPDQRVALRAESPGHKRTWIVCLHAIETGQELPEAKRSAAKAAGVRLGAIDTRACRLRQRAM